MLFSTIYKTRMYNRAANNLWGATGHVWSNMFLLGHDLFLAGHVEKIVTLAIVNPDCTVNLFKLKIN